MRKAFTRLLSPRDRRLRRWSGHTLAYQAWVHSL